MYALSQPKDNSKKEECLDLKTSLSVFDIPKGRLLMLVLKFSP